MISEKTLTFLCWHVEGHRRKKQNPKLRSGSVIHRTDPRIRSGSVSKCHWSGISLVEETPTYILKNLLFVFVSLVTNGPVFLGSLWLKINFPFSVPAPLQSAWRNLMNLASSSKIRLIYVFFSCVLLRLKVFGGILKNRSSFDVIKSPIVNS
jgi:hypothetical protein